MFYVQETSKVQTKKHLTKLPRRMSNKRLPNQNNINRNLEKTARDLQLGNGGKLGGIFARTDKSTKSSKSSKSSKSNSLLSIDSDEIFLIALLIIFIYLFTGMSLGMTSPQFFIRIAVVICNTIVF